MFNNVSDSLFAFSNEFECERANECAIERMDGRTNERTDGGSSGQSENNLKQNASTIIRWLHFENVVKVETGDVYDGNNGRMNEQNQNEKRSNQGFIAFIIQIVCSFGHAQSKCVRHAMPCHTMHLLLLATALYYFRQAGTIRTFIDHFPIYHLNNLILLKIDT